MNVGNYFVIYKDSEEIDFESYICKHKKNGGEYRIIASAEVKEEMIISESLKFTDFVEDFFISPYYYSVFRYSPGVKLSEILKDPDFDFDKRKEVLANILKTIIMKNIPNEFSKAALTAENIIITDDEAVSFNYSFPEKSSFSEVLLTLAKLTDTVFDGFYGKETEKWIKELKSNAFKNMCEVYYNMNIDEPLPEETITAFSFKDLAERLKGIAAIISAVLIPIIVGAALYFMLMTPEEAEGRITAIGTISLESDSNE